MKTLSYDCGNPVIICLRASARSAFLFTGSPRSFHSLAIKGTKCPSTHHSCHSRARGPRKYECICGVDKAGILYPFSNNSCHSRARGPRKYECICGVDKAGILYPFSNNSCHSRARGPRKYECICGVDKAGIGLGLLLVI